MGPDYIGPPTVHSISQHNSSSSSSSTTNGTARQPAQPSSTSTFSLVRSRRNAQIDVAIASHPPRCSQPTTNNQQPTPSHRFCMTHMKENKNQRGVIPKQKTLDGSTHHSIDRHKRTTESTS
ncbi:unnamed protein product, partial [Ectocarpus sp. 6 AP-2014]